MPSEKELLEKFEATRPTSPRKYTRALKMVEQLAEAPVYSIFLTEDGLERARHSFVCLSSSLAYINIPPPSSLVPPSFFLLLIAVLMPSIQYHPILSSSSISRTRKRGARFRDLYTTLTNLAAHFQNLFVRAFSLQFPDAIDGLLRCMHTRDRRFVVLLLLH